MATGRRRPRGRVIARCLSVTATMNGTNKDIFLSNTLVHASGPLGELADIAHIMVTTNTRVPLPLILFVSLSSPLCLLTLLYLYARRRSASPPVKKEDKPAEKVPEKPREKPRYYMYAFTPHFHAH